MEESGSIPKLPPERLYRVANLAALEFTTTADLVAPAALVEQPRAYEAIRFGTEMAVRGFNIFAIGANGAQIQGSVRALLDNAADTRPTPADWVYIYNFVAPHRPVAIALPSRRAPELAKAVDRLIDDVKLSLPAAFESEDYQKRRGTVEQGIRGRNEQALAALRDKATAKGVAILRTPMGFAMAPTNDGQVIPPQEFNTWPPERQQELQASIEELEKDLEQTLRAIPRQERELRDAVRQLDQDTARSAIMQPIEECKAKFADVPKVVAHLEAIEADILENAALFINPQASEEAAQAGLRAGAIFERYGVNVFVTPEHEGSGAPVIEEVHPTLSNLVGRIEHIAVQGALVTNFKLIKPGSLHRANGGALMIDLRNLLAEALSWPALKRALLRQEIVVEDASRFMGLATTVTLEPDPIPLDVKVVLFGDRTLYYLLASTDPDTAQHFKVLADFEDDVERSPASEAMIARLIGSIAGKAALKPLDRGGVARVIEHAARLADDAHKLTLLVESIHDLVAEASYCAGVRDVVTRADVERAIAQQKRRASRVEERGREMILRDIALIETSGSRVGQVNGLSVLGLGGHSFGRPTRITARVRPGTGRIVDIEREVELGGPIHSKGVLILGGFLVGRYALELPMSLYASLVFEQSYGGVEGDSASSAELYTLLSALSELPLRQDLAVTGSVNQHGQVQAIGGVNEKIEGFFDVCAARGLTGAQGVLIPVSNAQHLMLRADVVEACAAGQFAVYPVTTIDEGIHLLTGRPAGECGADGKFPDGSVNRLVEERLAGFALARKAMGRDAAGEAPGGT